MIDFSLNTINTYIVVFFRKPHFLRMTILHFAISCAAMVIGSMSSEAETDRDLGEVVWSLASYEKESAELTSIPWYQNYRYQGVGLLIIIAIILIIY